MKKIINIFLIFTILFCYFFPIGINIKAAGEFSVKVLDKNGVVEELGSVSNYDEAKRMMEEYPSDSSKVAAIYRNNSLINVKYGVIKFVPENILYLYLNKTDTVYYTSIHTSYGTDAAFIDYDINTNRVKLKISGFTGWVNFESLNIIPIPQLYADNLRINENITDALNVRSEPSSSGNYIGYVVAGQVFSYSEKRQNAGYTWYKINYNGTQGWIANVDNGITENVDASLRTYYQHWAPTGNLLHYYAYNTYGEEGQYYNNLGPAPSFLEGYKIYYSFDGNYFYDDVVKMLDDYRTDSTSKAVNQNPYYAYYLYLPNRSKTSYTADDLNLIITQKGYYSKPDPSIRYVDDNGWFINGINRDGISQLVGEGSSFIASQNEYGVNALLTFSAALNESANGTSAIAFAKRNLFGHNAYDSCPFTCATTYGAVGDSIFTHARLTGENYNNPNHVYYHGSHYGNKGSGMNVMYATDPYWGEKAAQNYFFADNSYGRADYLYNTIGIKQTYSDIYVYTEPNVNSRIIYNVNNDYENVPNIPLIVMDKIKVGDSYWYKIYTEIGLDENKNIVPSSYNRDYSYGYVKESDLYVSNNQPVISGQNITTKVGQPVDLKANVIASDVENGDLTNRITYSTNVNFDVAGDYQVTYYVKDNSNYNASAIYTISVEIDTNEEQPIETPDTLEEILKNKQEKESLFYMDYLQEKDNKLHLKGYSTIKGVNNNLDNDIKYKVIFRNVDNNEEVIFDADRITDRNQITRVPYSDDNLDYTYSWFDYSFNLADLPVGNYKAFVVAYDSNNYSISVVSNKLYKNQATSYVGDKALIIYRNFNDKTGAIEFNVRNDLLAPKNSSYMYNQYDTYRTFEFNDNKLHLKGLSYSYGMDLNPNIAVIRKIIFENKSSYQTYSYDLGSITDGLYTAVLPESDNLDKTRAWYDNTIDISNIPKGDYVIYMTTTSNMTDISEFTEKLGRSLDNVSTNINGLNYSFSINHDKGNRIELSVK